MKKIICCLLLLPFFSVAQHLEITSIHSDGTIVWTNSVSNLYYGLEYKTTLNGIWKEAPGEFWNMFVTGLVDSIQIPIDHDAMFFRLVCSTNYVGDYYDIVSNGIPQFVAMDYIELDKITAISRFRSGYGHDYSDDFESCRSMKHYYEPYGSINWGEVLIRAPVTGMVMELDDGWAGTEVRIKSSDYPAFYFTLFHVEVSPPLQEGDIVSEGQLLGTHIGSQTKSDIAVWVRTIEGERLVSYFDVMEDALFTNYIDRGASGRSDFIITEAERDADPLICDGETFQTPGTIPNWVYLSSP